MTIEIDRSWGSNQLGTQKRIFKLKPDAERRRLTRDRYLYLLSSMGESSRDLAEGFGLTQEHVCRTLQDLRKLKRGIQACKADSLAS